MIEHKPNEKNERSQSVLITGGSGLVGRYLTSVLLSEGYKVSHLSRRTTGFGKVRVYRWDPSKKILPPEALDGIDCIVHLAGENIGEKRWTASQRRKIINSRLDSAQLLFRTVIENEFKIKSFISASGVGYYGALTSDRIFDENDPPADDFPAMTCKIWEEGADLFQASGIRTVKIRSGVVLDKTEGALPRLIKPARYGLVVRLGTGKQYFPWIHLRDLCNIYLMSISDKNIHGAYNASSPEHRTHDEFMKILASEMKRYIFLPRVPSWLLWIVLGEMSDVVLKGSRISSDKIINAGYRFQFDDLENALRDIFSS